MREGRLRGVVFDLFHTLVDPEVFRPSAFGRIQEVARLFEVDPDALLAQWRAWVPAMVRAPVRPVDRIAAHLRSLGVETPASLLEEADEILGRYQDLAILQPDEETVEVVAGLAARGFRLGLLSNAVLRDVRAWDRSPLAPHFRAVLFSFAIGLAKPEPGAYEAALGALGTAASETAFVGDGGSDELAGARTHGLGLVVCLAGRVRRSGLRPPERIEAAARHAHATIDGIRDLLPLLGEPAL